MSRLSKRLPLNKNPNYGIMDIIFLRSFNLYELIFFPYTLIEPSCTSYNLNKAFKIEVFPDPVLPQKATFSPFFIVKLTSFNAYFDS